MKFCIISVIFLIGYIIEINAQYDSPVPRPAIIPGAIPARPLQIPGAVPVRGGPRQGRLLQARRPAPGFYRASPTPNLPPQPSYSTPIASKPVTEEPEEDNVSPYQNNEEQDFQEQIAQKQALLAQLNEDFTPSFLNTSPQTSPSPVQFRPEPKVPQVRAQQVRISPPVQRNDPPQPRQYQQQQPQPQYQQQQQQQVIQRSRPAPRPAPQQIQTPREYQHQGNERREKKPVAQILRKYQEENEDGSITWGYENDDGSFKEETIGTDCITRGKYGYVDPDGVRREYNYETGHACDPVEEEDLPQQVPQQQQQQQPKRPRY